MRIIAVLLVAMSIVVLPTQSASQERDFDLSQASVDLSRLKREGIVIINGIYVGRDGLNDVTMNVTESKVVDTANARRFALDVSGVPATTAPGQYAIKLVLRNPKLPLSNRTGSTIVLELEVIFADGSSKKGRRVFKG